MSQSQQSQTALRALLERRFAQMRTESPVFSLRQFSRSLGQNPAVISQIFSGKRAVSKKLALELAKNAGANLSAIRKLEGSYSEAGGADDLATGREPLDLAHYDLVAEWQYYAILSLAETKGFRSDATWIAKRLGISKLLAEKSIKRLVKLELLVPAGRGQLRCTGKQLITSDGIANLALRARHKANLESAARSLQQDPIEERDFTFLTLASTRRKLPEVRRRVRAFLNELCAFLEADEKEEVFEVCFQIFPRTQKERRK